MADDTLDRKTRAARVLAILDQYFPTVDIPLDHGDPFQLLVAVVLSAQCTDARVNMVTPKLFARAGSAPAMAKLTARQILPYIRTCGLAPGKAKSLAKLSRILVNDHAGAVPADMAALEALPGVGHKTASVVMSQAFHQPAFPVDTHIHRLAGRWQLSRARTVEEVERDLKALYPPERWNTLHLQIIYFGRSYCPARGHDPAACPICSWAMSKARASAELRQGLSKPIRPKRRPVATDVIKTRSGTALTKPARANTKRDAEPTPRPTRTTARPTRTTARSTPTRASSASRGGSAAEQLVIKTASAPTKPARANTKPDAEPTARPTPTRA